MAAGQGNVRNRKLAVAAGLMAEFDAGMLTRAGQAHTLLVAQNTLVIIEVCMTLDDYEGKKVPCDT